ncbi:MAG TPA: hypothetical protein VFQ37_15210 [Mycobacterium sp.]|nr:hypothetical protein [Mycobacterium sp.]
MSSNQRLSMKRLPDTDVAVPHIGRRRRWVTAAVGLGTPAAALLTAAMIGMGTAPAAHADDPISDVLGTFGATVKDFVDGGVNVVGFHLGQAIADFGAGIDNTLFGYLDDAVIGTTDFLTGTTLPAGDVPVEFAVLVPTNFSNAMNDAGAALGASLTDYSDAFKDFFSFTGSGLANSVDLFIQGLNDDIVYAPQWFGEGLLSVVGL